MPISTTCKILKTLSFLIPISISCAAWAGGVLPSEWTDFTPVREQPGLLVGAMGVLFVWVYYRAMKFLVSRGADTAIPSPQALASLSPAMLRYLQVKQVDQQCVVAALISMANKGAITIEEQHGTFVLRPKGTSRAALSHDETTLAAALLKDDDGIQLRTKAYDKLLGTIVYVKDERWQRRVALAEKIDTATKRFARALKSACSPKYLRHNLGAWGLGLLLSVVALAITLLADDGVEPTMAMVAAVFTLVVTAVVIFIPLIFVRWLWVGWRQYTLERRWSPVLLSGFAVTISAALALTWAIMPYTGNAHRFASPCVPLLALILMGMGMWSRVSLRTLTAEGRGLVDPREASQEQRAGIENACRSSGKEQSSSGLEIRLARAMLHSSLPGFQRLVD